MHERDPADKRMSPWIERLKTFGVFFSAPLDIDFLMLNAFPDAYIHLEEGERGPRVPDPEDNAEKYVKRIQEATTAVLGEHGGNGDTYTEDELGYFPWYSYRFLGQGKPSTHLMALSRLSDEQLLERVPTVFGEIFDAIKSALFLGRAKG